MKVLPLEWKMYLISGRTSGIEQFEKASKRRFPVEISPWQWPDQDWFKENELAGVKIREKLENWWYLQPQTG